jgi:hypothetical protein
MKSDEIGERLERAKEYKSRLMQRSLSFPALVDLAEDCISDLLDLIEVVTDDSEGKSK